LTLNRLKRPSAAVPVPPTKTEQLLQEIRDQLAKLEEMWHVLPGAR
jgi:hypothetical protein